VQRLPRYEAKTCAHMSQFTKPTVEPPPSPGCESIGWHTAYGPDIVPLPCLTGQAGQAGNMTVAERRDWGEVMLGTMLSATAEVLLANFI